MNGMQSQPRQRLASLNDTPQRNVLSKPQPSATPAIQAFIPEDYMSFLGGGPFNRFALALKSNLDNEIDWASARLATATQHAPEGWSLMQHAPFLLEAIIGAMERTRKEISQTLPVADIRKALVSDSGSAMHKKRAQERGELLATILFNIAQIGDNAQDMAQDPRVILEITQWLRVDGQIRMRAELLDVLDVLVPLAPVPPLDIRITEWPQISELLVLVEAQLWAELVKLVASSTERTLVLGAIRVLVQLISWHPQLARDILQLPVPRKPSEIVGSMLNARLAELVLSSDIDMVSASLELLLNTVRIEALAKALDHERGQLKSEDSGSQTPVFGKLITRSQETVEESAPSRLPSGLVSLIALVLQQWMTSILPAAEIAQPAKPATNQPPTELELREACTWVLLNYEFVQQQQQQQRPAYISINELFSRYTIAKQGQTTPRVGRALTLNEIVRVVAAVFPRTSIQKHSIALHLRQKTPHIVPIPELPAATEAKEDTKDTRQCKWAGCQEPFTSEEQALDHIQTHLADADACRWGNCNRIADSWLKRHILTHGPFYDQETTAKPPADTNSNEDNDKLKVLDLILPISSDKHQSVLRLVLQGIGVVEQLQKWADRRSGSQGEYDRARVWRCSDEAIERIMFIAAQHTTPVAVYAARLLAAIGKPSF